MYERNASYVGSFRANNQRFEHIIHSYSDDRVECVDVTGNVILTHTADCHTFDNKGKTLGRWSMDKNYDWVFYKEGSDTCYTFTNNLLKAEMAISQRYIEGML